MRNAAHHLVALCLVTVPAFAQQPPSSNGGASGNVRFLCSRHHFELSLEPVKSEPSWPDTISSETLDAAGLVTYDKEDEQGNVRRTGSREIVRRCGQYTIRFRGGFYNTNPQGELGAADDYPLIEILEQDRRIAGPIAMGSCDASNGLESRMAECPRNWATSLSLDFAFDSRPPSLWLRHGYEDYRSVPDKPEPTDQPSSN